MTATLLAFANASWPGGYVTIGLVVLLAAVLFLTRPEVPGPMERRKTPLPGRGSPHRRMRTHHRAIARRACGRLTATVRARRSLSR